VDFMDFRAHTFAVSDVVTGTFVAWASTHREVIEILHGEEISEHPDVLDRYRVVAYDAAGHKINEWSARDVSALGQPV
jgi:hypothetical protein